MAAGKSNDTLPLCPSAQPSFVDSLAIGVVGGTAEEPRVHPLKKPLPVTLELLELAEPVRPTEVFRFAAPCLSTGCAHFAESSCRLATRVVALLPEVQEKLPTCGIRRRCQWFAQEGAAACRRCPQVVTDDANRSTEITFAADPRTPSDSRPDARNAPARQDLPIIGPNVPRSQGGNHRA